MTSPIRLHLRGHRLAGPIAALTMTGALMTGLAACSSAGESDSGGSDSMTSSQVAPSESSDRSSSGDDSGGDAAGSPSKAYDSDTGVTSGDVDSSATGTTARPPAMERHVISNGTVSLVSDDVSKARREVQRIVDAQHGTVTQENTETDDEGTATYSRLVIRVPSSSFAVTMLSLEKAAELRQSQVSSEDVTTQVIDTDVRVRAQEGSLRRVEQLLARANTLKDIIWIESQLTRRQSELDSLKSQQAWLSDQTADSTITIDIEHKSEKKAEKKKDPEDTGFLAGLTGGMNALGGFATAMATIVGALLPFAIVVAIFGAPVWLLVRRTARRRPPKEPATS